MHFHKLRINFVKCMYLVLFIFQSFDSQESCNDFDDMDEKISVTDSALQASVDASGNTPPELVNAQKDYEGAKENYLALRNRWLPFEEQ